MTDNLRSFQVFFKIYPAFQDAMDTHWKAKGFKNRTAYIKYLIAKDIKWKWPC